MNESTVSASNADSRWTDVETFLPAGRTLFDPETNELNRASVPILPFSANSADVFDLATTTVALLERMYTALTRLWADSHPLLGHRVVMLNLQTQYRAFHRYSIDAIHQYVLQPAIREVTGSGGRGGGRRGTPPAVSVRTIESLRETVRRDREQERYYERLAGQLENEVRVLEQQMDEMLRTLSSRNEAGKYRYLERLAEAKAQRVRLLQEQINEVERTGALASYNRLFERQLLDTLNQSVAAVAGLRAAVDVSPTLFAGVSPRGQLNIVLPRMGSASLPDALLGLYQELYLSLNEVSVRNLLERQFGAPEVVSGNEAPPETG